MYVTHFLCMHLWPSLKIDVFHKVCMQLLINIANSNMKDENGNESLFSLFQVGKSVAEHRFSTLMINQQKEEDRWPNSAGYIRKRF